MELEILARSLAGGSGIWHHLYGEKTYQLSGFMKNIRRDWQVATFHHHPARYKELVPNTKYFRSLDQAIVVSSVQQDMIGDLVGKDRVKCIPHGVDTEYWHPKPVDNSARRKLVFAGTHMRDLDALEKIVKALLEIRNDVEFVLVSSDLRCAEIANRRNVRWLYQISDESYRSELQEAALTVLPLQHSTAVNTVLESIACGTPVVTTAGGINDYLDESYAVSLKTNNCDDFVDAIMMLLDRKNLDGMRLAARHKAKSLSWEKVSVAVRQSYMELL